MKRALFETVKVLPYASGTAIDRLGFHSAILAASATAAGTATLAVTHCDTAGGTYEPVPDKGVALWHPLTNIDVAAGEQLNVELDLLGCKRYVKVTATGAAATYAIVLGDADKQPV